MPNERQILPLKIKFFLSRVDRTNLPGLVAVYRFTVRKQGQSQVRESDKLLLLLEPEVSLEEVRITVQIIQNQLQDQLPFPDNIIEPVILRHTSD